MLSPDSLPESLPSPDRSGSPSSEYKSAADDSAHGDDNSTHLPPVISQSFVDRILWPPTGTSEPELGPVEESPSVAFSDGLTTRVRASIEYAFYSAERLSKTVFAGSVTLYCPVPLGNPILDSMLKLVANQVDADVIELDALELVTGSLGLDTTAVNAEINGQVPRSLYSSVAPGTDERKNLEAFFAALINVPSARGTTRRILYLRDISSIAISAKPLVSVLLRAIQDNHEENCVFTFLLVFGVSAKWKRNNGNKTEFLARSKRDSSSLLPALTAKICSPRGMAVDNLAPLAFAADLNPSPAAGGGLMFLQMDIDKKDEDIDSDSDSEDRDHAIGNLWSTTTRSSWIRDDESPAPRNTSEAHWIRSLYEDLQAAIQNTPVLIIEPGSTTEEPDQQLLEEHFFKSRVEEVNRAMMRVIVRKSGACLPKQAENVWVLLARIESRVAHDSPHRSTVLPLSSVRLTASMAIGLSTRESTSLEAPVLTSHHILQAHSLSKGAGGSKLSTGRVDSINPPPSVEPNKGKKSATERIAELESKHDLSPKEKMFISRIFRPDLLQKTSFSDVVIDPQVKETLRSIISLPLLHPHHFSSGILANEALSGILLYGPPGTGKTLVCRALAVDFGVPMIIVQPSDILDKYYGESEKMAAAVFSVAHQIAPCIVFIDEVDAIFRARSSGREGGGGADMHRSMLTEFMTAMDGIQTNGADGVVVIGATNRPFDLDAAILRRLPRRMIIDLPPAAQRQEILELYLRSETCAADVDISDIARRTEFFSGSDLKNLCVSAALEAVNESILAPPAVVDAKPESEPRALRLITQAHFARALQLIAPSFSAEANAELYGWHAEYNIGGGGV